MDPNGVRRKCKIIKYLIKTQGKVEKDIDRIQEKLKVIEWTDETMTYRKGLYEELGKIIQTFRNNRIIIKWYKQDLLEKYSLTA